MVEKQEPAALPPDGESPGTLRRVSAATAQGARTAAPDVASGATRSWEFVQSRILPPLRRLVNRIGDWLAVVGWGKFALVAILLLAFAGIASNVIYDESPVVVVDRHGPREKVKVDIKVGADGIRIERPNVPQLPKPPPAPAAPKAPKPPGVALGKGESAVNID